MYGTNNMKLKCFLEEESGRPWPEIIWLRSNGEII
jgi:hypothetical protein